MWYAARGLPLASRHRMIRAVQFLASTRHPSVPTAELASRTGLGVAIAALVIGCSGAAETETLEPQSAQPLIEAQVVVHRSRTVTAQPADAPTAEALGSDAPPSDPADTPADSDLADAHGVDGAADVAAGEQEVPDAQLPPAPAYTQERSAEAIARFIQASSIDLRILSATGFNQDVPALGTCAAPSRQPITTSFANVEEVRLLDVGEVILATRAQERAEVVSLAPQAFPSVSGFASGVVYTSRDRSAAALPSGAEYEINVSGTSELPSFALRGSAPHELTEITLGGEPFESVTEVDVRSPLDVTWKVGHPDDRVLVDLVEIQSGGLSARCAFADDLGAATITTDVMGDLAGEGRVVLHRLRSTKTPLGDVIAAGSPQPGPAGSTVSLDFDFQTGIVVDFGD